MEAPVAKDLQIFSPTHPALLEDCVPVRSSRWWQVLIKRGWWRTAAPVDGQWWGRFLSWKGVWWALAPSCIWIQANGINLNCFSSSNIFAFPQKFLTQYLTRRGAWQRAASATPGWRSRPSLEPVAALQPRPERCWDVQDQAVTSSQQVNYLAVEVQDVARRCIAAEPPILIENNYEFPFFSLLNWHSNPFQLTCWLFGWRPPSSPDESIELPRPESLCPCKVIRSGGDGIYH